MDKTQRCAIALVVATAIALTLGCAKESGSDTQPVAGSAGASESAPADEVPATGGEQPTELNAAHILIMHKDSARVPPEITRTKEEAMARAQEVAEKLKAEGADFAALASEYSDCPSKDDGGKLGDFRPQQMDGKFSEATMKLAVGEVSEIVETPFGYHIIRRQELSPRASAKHILVMHKDSMRVPPDITRTKEEALARIEECLKRAEAGESFEELAREISDCPSKEEGGDLGEFAEGMMAPAFEEATFACEVGKTTGIVETPFGYHIIYRYK